MTRTFRHTFDPPGDSPVGGPEVELTVREIEDAGLREVLQTPGASFGSWAILGSLLGPGAPFVFREPLGQAREVKVALSGLFGRFVARAYLKRYFNLSIFASLGRETIVLDGRRSIAVRRCANGDLPDWVAATSSLGNLTVAEAKGSHDPSGPEKALDRAWAQAGRVDILSNGRQATVKRMAIVTRWGVSEDGPHTPCIAVRNAIDEGDSMKPDEEGATFVGLFRHHIAGLITPLGHEELAGSLRDLASAGNERDEGAVAERTHRLLDGDFEKTLVPSDRSAGTDGLIGGVVTRAGPVAGAAAVHLDQEALDAFALLDLRPVFVGIERDLVYAAIEGDPSSLREALTGPPNFDGVARDERAALPGPPIVDDRARGDRTGGWIVPLGDETDTQA